jgi:hypothetical protein
MMDRYELKETLSKGVVTVTFDKRDGSLREMRCTLQPDLLPPQLLQENETPRKENLEVLSVWDIESHGWRSFRMDSIKSIAVG